MPILNQGGGDDMLRMAFQMIQQAQERRARQAEFMIRTAEPGATVGGLGMSKKVFQEAYGKDTPYEPTRVLKPQTSKDVMDKMVRQDMANWTPDEINNQVATYYSTQAGTPGVTTKEGVARSRKAAEAKAGFDLTTAEGAAAAARKGVDSFQLAPEKTQQALGQQLAYGRTFTTVEADEAKNLLASASMREVALAQQNPNHPMHAWLKKLDLDLPTVMGSMAMGAQSLLSSYVSSRLAHGENTDQMALARLKAKLGVAEHLSKTTFQGALTPDQVVAIFDAKESGKGVPAGLEKAAAIYDQGVAAFYNAGMMKALTEGNPQMLSIQQQIKALSTPNMDPNVVTAIANLSRNAAALGATLAQFGPQPTNDPVAAKKWNDAFGAYFERAPQQGLNVPYARDVPGAQQGPIMQNTVPGNMPAAPTAPAPGPQGPVAPSFIFGQPRPAMAPPGPVQPVAPVQGPMLSPTQQTPVGTPTTPTGLSPDDSATMAAYMQYILGGGGTPR